MNHAQRIAVLIGCLVIAAMAVYPPWLLVEPKEAPAPMGYAFIWDPPSKQREAHFDILGVKVDVGSERVEANKIDFSKLLTQLAAVAVLTGGVVVLLRRRQLTA